MVVWETRRFPGKSGNVLKKSGKIGLEKVPRRALEGPWKVPLEPTRELLDGFLEQLTMSRLVGRRQQHEDRYKQTCLPIPCKGTY